MYLPAKTAPDLFSLNNGFFAQFKGKLCEKDLSTQEKKKASVVEAIKNIPEEAVQKYFVHCGLLSNQQLVEEDVDCFLLSEQFQEININA